VKDAPLYRLIAFDPGKVTGCAVAEVYRDTAQVPWSLHTAPILAGRAIRILGTENIDYADAPKDIKQVLEQNSNDNVTPHVVAEKFVINQQGFAGQALWSAQVTGMIIALAETLYFPLEVDTSQMPSAAKTVAPRKLLREMGVLQPRMTQHQVDALSHVVLHVVRNAMGKTSTLV